MIKITAEIRALIDKAAAGMELTGEEYIDPADGLIHCKKCGGQRQTVVPCFGKPGYFMPRCICQCQQEAEEQRKAAEERQRRMERIKRRKAQGLQDRYLYDYTFANDNGQNPLMDKARAYVENWKEAYKSNIGLLLFGDVGTGKSFFAGCIANALLDRDVPVLMTNFPTILNRLTGMSPKTGPTLSPALTNTTCLSLTIWVWSAVPSMRWSRCFSSLTADTAAAGP